MRLSITNVRCWLILLLFALAPGAQAENSYQTAGTAREFVQGFLDWYLPRDLVDGEATMKEIIRKQKTGILDPELARLLREDRAAQDRCNEVVGIEFDPFLNTQDPAQRYEAGNISQTGQHYRVDIYGIESGKRHEKPDLSAEVLKRNGRWTFINFYYPDGNDLLAILKAPREKCTEPRPPARKKA